MAGWTCCAVNWPLSWPGSLQQQTATSYLLPLFAKVLTMQVHKVLSSAAMRRAELCCDALC